MNQATQVNIFPARGTRRIIAFPVGNLKVILAVLATLLAFEARSQFTEILSGGGSTNGPQILAMSVSSSGKIFAGTLMGIYVSENSGASWIPSNQGLTDGAVNAFALNESSIFVAMNSGGGVLRSSDDGGSWSKVNNGLPSFAVIRLAATSGRVFGLINNGTLFYSDDNGDSWSQMTNAPSGVNSLARSGTTIFLASSAGVYRSTDTGTSWVQVNSGLTNTNVIKLVASENTLVVWTFGGTFISTDNGASWRGSGLPTGYPNITQNGSTILVSYVLGQMKRSTNNGVSWTTVTNVPATGSMVSAGNYFFAGTVDGVYVSQDDGITWSPANIGLTDARPSLSADGATIIATDGIAVKVSKDWGETFTSHTVGVAADISVLAKGNLLYTSSREAVWSSADKGLTWTEIPTFDSGMTLGSVDGNLFAVDEYYLYQSASGGPWVQRSSSVRWISSLAGKGNKIFAGSMFGGDVYTGIFSSEDAGASWQQVNNTLPQINSMAYDGTLLVCGTSSGVYKSVDGGINWTLAVLEGTNVNSVIFHNGDLLAAHKGIEISNDNGVSWTSMTGEIGASLGTFHEITTLVSSGTRILAATSTGSVWISKCVDPPTPSVTGTWNHHPTTLSSNTPMNNQWFLNGQEIIGATGTTLEVTASGTYSVKVIVDGCPSEMSALYDITDCIIPPIPTISISDTGLQTSLTSSAAEGNQWFLNGTLIQGANDQVYVPTTSGNYSVQVTLEGCLGGMSSTFPVVITGILDGENTAIEIYPNPVSDELIVSNGSLSPNRQIEARVTDLFGKLVYSDVIADTYPFSINTSFLVSGVYIVEVNGSGKKLRRRFVKK